MVTCISTELQIYASRPHKCLGPLSSFYPKYTRVRMLNINHSFPRCSANNLSVGPIINSRCSFFLMISNLFDDNFKPMQTLSRMLPFSVLLSAVMTMALFCTQNSAFASSYGTMGGGSSDSSSSSSSYYTSDDDYSSSSCNWTCTSCVCYKEKKNGKSESCTDCNCYKEKECSSHTDTTTSLLTCSCNCHLPCECSCHDPVLAFAKLLCTIFFIGAVIFAIVEVDTMRGSVIMIQVGILDKNRVLQRKLNRISGNADTLTKTGLNSAMKEVAKALLEHHDSCRFAYLYAKYDDLKKHGRPCFRKFLQTEVGKFDKEDETFVNVDGVKFRKASAGKVSSIDNEYSVVTLLVLADGKYLIPSLKSYTRHVKKVDVKTALQTIRSIQTSNLEAVKALWTPQMENDVVTEQEVRRDFGILMRSVD